MDVQALRTSATMHRWELYLTAACNGVQLQYSGQERRKGVGDREKRTTAAHPFQGKDADRRAPVVRAMPPVDVCALADELDRGHRVVNLDSVVKPQSCSASYIHIATLGITQYVGSNWDEDNKHHKSPAFLPVLHLLPPQKKPKQKQKQTIQRSNDHAATRLSPGSNPPDLARWRRRWEQV